jgi:hypothetical protein
MNALKSKISRKPDQMRSKLPLINSRICSVIQSKEKELPTLHSTEPPFAIAPDTSMSQATILTAQKHFDAFVKTNSEAAAISPPLVISAPEAPSSFSDVTKGVAPFKEPSEKSASQHPNGPASANIGTPNAPSSHPPVSGSPSPRSMLESIPPSKESDAKPVDARKNPISSVFLFTSRTPNIERKSL